MNDLSRTEKSRPEINWDRISYSSVWQITVVLTFLLLFWTLASISPSTDKTHSQYLWVGEILLFLLWISSLFIAIKRRQNTTFKIIQYVKDHPQIWVAIIYLVLSSPDIKVLPMCDNGAYFKSVLDAVKGFDFTPANSLKAMILFGHPAFGYAAFMMLGQFISYGNFVIANIQERILSISAILAFAGIVDYFFASRFGKVERLLITAIFAFTPLAYGLTLTVSPDYAILAFLCLTVYFYLHKFPILTLASGIMLCFSKEAGALIYGFVVLGLFSVLLPYASKDNTSKFKIKIYADSLVKNLYLVFPLLLFIFYILINGQLWVFKNPQDLLQSQSYLTLDPIVIHDKTIQVFLASFNWVIWGTIGFAGLIAIIRRLTRPIESNRKSEENLWLIIFALALIPFLVSNYLIKTWNNARYLVPVIFFELIFFFKTLEVFRRQIIIKIGILSISFVLFLASCFRTFDPVLLHFFPTFMFGDHRMSFYNSEFTLCDLTLYNREYVYYNRLFDRFLQDAKFNPSQDEFVFMTDNYLVKHNITYNWTGEAWTGNIYIDPRTGTRTFNPGSNLILKAIVVQGDTSSIELPVHAFSIRIFWRKSLGNQADTLIKQYYNIVREIHAEEDGYFLDGYELELKK